MDTIKIIAIFIIILIIGIATVMFFAKQINKQTDISEFFGTWKGSEQSSNESITNILFYEWSFHKNNTVHMVITLDNGTINDTVIDQWHFYDLVPDDTIKIEASTGQIIIYHFSFSADKEELIITKDGVSMTFQKQQLSK